MIMAADLEAVRARSGHGAHADDVERGAIEAAFRASRAERHPFFLTGEELSRVFRWKLRGQHERMAAQRARNTEAAYRLISQAVFQIVGPDLEYESMVRLGLLTALTGVGVPIASAVLALAEPQKYCIVDRRGWRAVFGRERESFTPIDYWAYREAVARLAIELGWTLQETDLAIRHRDRLPREPRPARHEAATRYRSTDPTRRPAWTAPRIGLCEDPQRHPGGADP